MFSLLLISICYIFSLQCCAFPELFSTEDLRSKDAAKRGPELGPWQLTWIKDRLLLSGERRDRGEKPRVPAPVLTSADVGPTRGAPECDPGQATPHHQSTGSGALDSRRRSRDVTAPCPGPGIVLSSGSSPGIFHPPSVRPKPQTQLVAPRPGNWGYRGLASADGWRHEMLWHGVIVPMSTFNVSTGHLHLMWVSLVTTRVMTQEIDWDRIASQALVISFWWGGTGCKDIKMSQIPDVSTHDAFLRVYQLSPDINDPRHPSLATWDLGPWHKTLCGDWRLSLQISLISLWASLSSQFPFFCFGSPVHNGEHSCMSGA